MVIIGPNKSDMIIVDNMCHIYIDVENGNYNERYVIRYGTENGKNDLLARYSSIERAREVLELIRRTYRMSESYKYTRDIELQNAIAKAANEAGITLFQFDMPQT